MKTLLISCSLLALLSCGTGNSVKPAIDVPTGDALTIRTGTSFGFCVGYCQKDYQFSGTQGQLTQAGTRDGRPAKSCPQPLTLTDWNALKTNADFETFARQPEQLGCPDCADGGAEYIELELNGRKHRVTFEYGRAIPGFEALVEGLRKQREARPACP